MVTVNIDFLRETDRRIYEMNVEIGILREQLEETLAALRHSQDYAVTLKHDMDKIDEDNMDLMRQVVRLEGGGGQEIETGIVVQQQPHHQPISIAKSLDEMNVSELVVLAGAARQLLQAVNQRIVAWCNSPAI